ncbi:MAG: Phosphatidate cytidylyltransferase [Phycisphaerae bacterium]|nr:Phosphatidate cytidylyltransferase [Phycisphaerae bacterium]
MPRRGSRDTINPMIVQRISFGALMIAALVALFWGDIQLARQGLISQTPWQYGSLIPLAVVVLGLCGAVECLSLSRAANHTPMTRAILFGVALLNLSAWLVPVIYPDQRYSSFEIQMVILVLSTMMICTLQIHRHSTQHGLANMAVSTLILMYMGILPSFLISLRGSLPGAVGAYAVIMSVAVIKCTDIGAYFTGITLGKTKLIPEISPGKTVEGLLGGMVWAVIASWILAYYLPWGTNNPQPISTYQAAIFGLLMAIVGQIGDLVESVIKRDASSKDSGKVLPGFGGFLDLLDSPVFAAPLAYLLLKAWLS